MRALVIAFFIFSTLPTHAAAQQVIDRTKHPEIISTKNISIPQMSQLKKCYWRISVDDNEIYYCVAIDSRFMIFKNSNKLYELTDTSHSFNDFEVIDGESWIVTSNSIYKINKSKKVKIVNSNYIFNLFKYQNNICAPALDMRQPDARAESTVFDRQMVRKSTNSLEFLQVSHRFANITKCYLQTAAPASEDIYSASEFGCEIYKNSEICYIEPTLVDSVIKNRTLENHSQLTYRKIAATTDGLFVLCYFNNRRHLGLLKDGQLTWITLDDICEFARELVAIPGKENTCVIGGLHNRQFRSVMITFNN